MYDNEQVIHSLFWLCTGKENECKKKECQSEFSNCLDNDQMIFLKSILDESQQWNLSLNTRQMLLQEANVCIDRRELIPDRIPLIKPRLNADAAKECLDAAPILETLQGERLMYFMPIILGINSKFEIENRMAIIQACINDWDGGQVFAKIFREILVKAIQLYVQKQNIDNKCIGLFVENFFESLATVNDQAEELNDCVNKYYDRIDGRCCSIDKTSTFRTKYSRLHNNWQKQKEKRQNYSLKCLMEKFENWSDLRNWLYMIQDVCKMAGFPCVLQEEFSQEKLYTSLETAPELIQQFHRLISLISQIPDWKIRERIADELVNMINTRGGNWDEELLSKLIDQAQRERYDH